MQPIMLLLVAVFVFVIVISGSGVSAQLSANFYATSCPTALSTIKTATDSAVSQEARMGASLLRLHFVFISMTALSMQVDHFSFTTTTKALHTGTDAGPNNRGFIFNKNGCDASVLLDDTANFTGEKTAGPNVNSLRGFEVIDNIKTQLESACPGVVSCADILTVAARDSVVALNGPSWNVVLGRRDSTTASLSGANSNIPGPGLSLSALITSFANKGFNANELVALSGSHTIGQARCVTFRNRIYNDTNINATFATSLQGNCPTSGGNGNLSPLDPSPNAFDNAYFSNLLTQRGLLHSDQELFNGGSTDSLVNTYASNSATFFTDFANAMVKMGNLSPLTGSNGQIRTNCRRTN